MNHISEFSKQKELAERFHALHHAADMLLLINAWDCTSAKILELEGFHAVATSSAGMAWSLGYQDGEKIPPQEVINCTKRITAVVKIPVSVDIEGGYFRDDVNMFSNFIAQLVDAGAVGINLEDGYSHSEKLNEIDKQMVFINAAKEAGAKKGVQFFVNARTDAMLLKANLEIKIQHSIERATAFAAAGADGIFIPFIRDMETVATLKSEIKLPLNILLTDTLNINKLKELKVNRVSTGSRPMMAMLKSFREMVSKIKTEKNMSPLFTSEISYNEINNWF